MIDISLIAQDIIDGENTFKTSPDTYDRSKFGLLSHASQFNELNISDTSSQQRDASSNTISQQQINKSQQQAQFSTSGEQSAEHAANTSDDIIVQGGYITNYFDMNACKSLNELLKVERKKYVNAANLTGGSTITLKNHSKSLSMYPFTLNLLQ